MLRPTRVSRLVRSGSVALTPSCWTTKPAGWYLVPSSTLPATEELRVGKCFDFLNHSAQYLFLGQVMALAEEVKCIPWLEWFYSELHFSLPPTKEAELLANYMNDQERLRCGLRNHSEGGTSSSDIAWSRELKERVQRRAEEDFCWLLTHDQRKTEKFLQETFIQWHHRADYLVTRKSREKREFREDLTLQKVIQQGQERKRRMQRRRNRDEARQEAIKSGKESEWDNFTHDVLPRELREALDRESDGMEDVRLSRAGTATGGWSRSMRSHPNFR
ncbi:conserved hypothetical protein [Leishmania major strain Friedlin]|uniref:Uncharacterized protein n=1 Tax=Leishmania major TaxID=5664 RepID=Q4QAG4_LEIMA|nr:conserved hypothetical protein [Leishmania major strain Friedlin]CAG9574640.1 hypothetical_protein_-_conserved [Leishmania major strain Friedlin]CAJ05178.1 conserved hypothetical protein [Leishmania major strain Friedlin]|eukprot:XP_001683684.1 conserved hypothetical protein [Leishmania major strain Friedlin]